MCDGMWLCIMTASDLWLSQYNRLRPLCMCRVTWRERRHSETTTYNPWPNLHIHNTSSAGLRGQFNTPLFSAFWSNVFEDCIPTRHRASTSMYSLTFCIRVMLPECHQWKTAVQAAAVMLRTPPVDGQSPASQPRALPIYAAQFWELPHHPPVIGQLRACRPGQDGRSH